MVPPSFLYIVHARRGSVAVMVALLALPMIGAVGLVADVSIWFLEQHRLQIAADAAAHAAAMQLQNTTLQTGSSGAFADLVSNEARAATGGGSLIGTLNTPVLSVGSGYTSITVALTSKADTYFANALRSTPVTLHATATAGVQAAAPCVLALSPTAANALDAEGTGSIIANGCSVFSNSSSSTAIYATGSGKITAKSIGTHGNYQTPNGGQISPTTVTTGAAAQSDPVANQYTLPSMGSCNYNNLNYTSNNNGQPYALTPGTYCGTTAIGGNGSSDTLAPGTYIFTGDVTINNANITQGTGVTFVMVGATGGAAAGKFTWQNNSAATLTAPTNGSMAGLLFWQACPSGKTAGSTGNGLIEFNGGSAFTAAGTVYAPCGALKIDNNAQVRGASNGSFGAVAATISVVGNASLQAATSSGSAGGQVSLLQ